MGKYITGLLLVIFLGASANAQTGNIMGPQYDAAAIRAARAAGASHVRRLTFAVSGGFEAGAAEQVDLAEDYILVTEAGSAQLFDFRLRRKFFLDAAHKGFSNASLYADLAFRVYESENRFYLNKILTGAKAGSALETPGQIEMELGVAVPGESNVSLEQKTDADGTLHFTLDGVEMAQVRFGAARFTPDEEKTFSRFLVYGQMLHPDIVTALVADGRIPTEITYREIRPKGSKLRTLTLQSAQSLDADYPLTADYARAQEDKDSRLKDLMPLMLEAVAGRANGGPRSIADYRAAIEAAAASSHNLQVAMLYGELSLQDGAGAGACEPGAPPDCRSPEDLAAAANQDPSVQAFVKALSLNGANAPKAVPELQGIDRAALSDPYMIDLYLANDQPGAPETEAHYHSAIRGNPYIAGFYKDYGFYLARDYDLWNAWNLYDLARSLPTARKTGLLQPIDNMEERLARDFPQFF